MSSRTCGVAVAVSPRMRPVCELLQALAERQVGRTEVVAPLRDAVRLVDGDQPGRHDLEQPPELGTGERFGRGQDEQRAALGDARQPLAAIGDADGAVEPDRRHAELLHLEVLVLEQREQRRHHHRRRRQQQRRELVAERLAATRRHHEQRVVPGEDGLDRPLLLAMQTRDSEALARNATRLVQPDRGRTLRLCALQRLHSTHRSLVARSSRRPARPPCVRRVSTHRTARVGPRTYRAGGVCSTWCASPRLVVVYRIGRGKSTLP